MENVNVVENMINSSSKTDMRLKMVYLFVAQSFVLLAAELTKVSHQCSHLRFYCKAVRVIF